jgi:hypothetical protein
VPLETTVLSFFSSSAIKEEASVAVPEWAVNEKANIINWQADPHPQQGDGLRLDSMFSVRVHSSELEPGNRPHMGEHRDILHGNHQFVLCRSGVVVQELLLNLNDETSNNEPEPA